MRRFRVRGVVGLLLFLPLLYFLNMWIWSESRSHANQQTGLVDFEDDDMLWRKIQGKAKEPDPDVAAVAEKEVESLGELGEKKELCPAGSFRLAAMERATWRGHTVAYSNLTRKHFPWRHFFLNDVAMLRTLQSPHVVQMVGSCNTTFLTEYHRLGSADKIEAVLAREEFSKFNNVRTRFDLAMSYLRAMHYLHNSPVGKLVLCDSNRLKKTLSRFLITEDLKLVLNDLDSVLEANPKLQLFIKCNFNKIEHKSDFFALEQRRPFQNGKLNYSMLPSYNEKMDIWKIPTVVDYLLGKMKCPQTKHVLPNTYVGEAKRTKYAVPTTGHRKLKCGEGKHKQEFGHLHAIF
ncbi:POMK [Branchiostoma lanceolatum]|uniref:POMK protein n=1 Tax=Branchiostoma lanceolatum TaxID=7740 RepID=A0A8K0ELA1_BRALA|nr:POMK [Branchiostoma lanceolatum]